MQILQKKFDLSNKLPGDAYGSGPQITFSKASIK